MGYGFPGLGQFGFEGDFTVGGFEGVVFGGDPDLSQFLDQGRLESQRHDGGKAVEFPVDLPLDALFEVFKHFGLCGIYLNLTAVP